MSRYAVLIDGEAGAYEVTVPDCPGYTAMGAIIDEAMANAATALAEWVGDRIAAGLAPPPPRSPETLRAAPALTEAMAEAALGLVPLLLESGRSASTSRSTRRCWRRSTPPPGRAAFLVSAARNKIAAGG